MTESALTELAAELAPHLGQTAEQVQELFDQRPLQVVINAEGWDVTTRIAAARILKQHNDLHPVTHRVVLASATTEAAPAEH